LDFERKSRLLRGLLTLIGLTATLTGIFAVLTGSSGQADGAQATPSVESELRFFAAFWIAYGAAALYVAPRVAREIHAVRALAVFLFLGGVARGIAWIADGRPQALFIVLLALELLLPPAILLLQRSMLEEL
jgi:Domain of unknown function (DUF4345)